MPGAPVWILMYFDYEDTGPAGLVFVMEADAYAEADRRNQEIADKRSPEARAAIAKKPWLDWRPYGVAEATLVLLP